MALHHFPRIVTDGLVLCLDAANPLSYPSLGPELVTNSDLLVADDGNYETIKRTTTEAISVTNVGLDIELGKTYQMSWKVSNLRLSNTGAQVRRGSSTMSGAPNLALSPGFYISNFTNNISTGNMNIYGDNTNGVDFDLDYLSVKEMSTTIYDISGNGNNANFASTTQCPKFYSDNKGVIFFDGADSMSLSKTAAQMNISDTAMTLCVYLNKSSPFNTNVLQDILQGCVGFTAPTLSIKTNATRMFLDLYSSNNTRYTPALTPTISEDSWHFVCFTINNNIIKTYYNGVFFDSRTMDASIATIQSLLLSFGSGYNYYQFKGKIGQCLMYNEVLSDEQILQNFNVTKGRYGL